MAMFRTAVGMAVAGFCSAGIAAGQDVRVLQPHQGGLPGRIGPDPETRVLLLPPTTLGRPVPPPSEATQALRRAIEEAADDVVFVDTLPDATDLVQITNYQLALDEQRGVLQMWQVSFRPLVAQDEAPAARARPTDFTLAVEGRTLSECTRIASGALREKLRPLLVRFRPVVPR